MAGLFGRLQKSQKEEAQVVVPGKEEASERTKNMIQGLTNIHLYGQLALEDAETLEMKEQLQAILAESQRLLEQLAEE